MSVLSINLHRMDNARVAPSPIPKPYRILTIFSLLLLAGIMVYPDNRVDASPDAVRWTEVNIPTNGQGGNWVLAGGSDVLSLTEY